VRAELGKEQNPVLSSGPHASDIILSVTPSR
jgi:hypothetical protein